MEPTSTTTEHIRNFVSEITFTDIDKIKEDTLLFEESIFDSLGFLSLITFIEEEFGIEVAEDELNEENFESVKAVVNFIGTKNNQ